MAIRFGVTSSVKHGIPATNMPGYFGIGQSFQVDRLGMEVPVRIYRVLWRRCEVLCALRPPSKNGTCVFIRLRDNAERSQMAARHRPE
jgi:hypothetical protein